MTVHPSLSSLSGHWPFGKPTWVDCRGISATNSTHQLQNIPPPPKASVSPLSMGVLLCLDKPQVSMP